MTISGETITRAHCVSWVLTASCGVAGTSLGCSEETLDGLGVYLTAVVPSIEANNGGASFVL